MRAKLMTMGMSLLLALALGFELSAALAFAQEGTTQSTANTNASKPRRTKSRAKKTKAAAPASETAAPAEQATPEAAAPAAEAKPAQRASRRRGRRVTRGVPTGVQNCIDRLIEISSADPLPSYEGQPQQIVNNGLLWNDPKSKCSVASDANLRGKVFTMSNAWRMNDAAKVRSLLHEIKSAAPQG